MSEYEAERHSEDSLSASVHTAEEQKWKSKTDELRARQPTATESNFLMAAHVDWCKWGEQSQQVTDAQISPTNAA